MKHALNARSFVVANLDAVLPCLRVIGLCSLVSVANAATYQYVDPLPGDGSSMYVRFASDDGGTVVAYSSNNSRFSVWTDSLGTQELLLPGDTSANARGMSANGAAVVGQSVASDGRNRAFVWSMDGSIQAIDPIPGFEEAFAEAVSADGSTVAGYCSAAGVGSRAFIWTALEGIEDIALLPGDTAAYATHISADGTTVVGQSFGSGGVTRGFVRTTAGVQAIDPLPGDLTLLVHGVSADGSVVFGQSYSGGNGYHATIWTAAAGTRPIPKPMGVDYMTPRFVSLDGNTVTGYLGGGGYGQTAWVWTATTGTLLLELPAATGSIPDDLSGDGTTVVGESFSSDGTIRGFVWTAASGIEAIDPIPGFNGSYALSVSFDGSTATGGYTAQTGDLGFRWRRGIGAEAFQRLPDEEWSWGEIVSADGSRIIGSSCAVQTGYCRVVVSTWANSTNTVTTPTGDDVTIGPVITTLPGGGAPVSVQLTFDAVTSAGNTTVTASSDPTGDVPASPPTFSVGNPPVYYDVDTTASFAGPVALCFSWQDGQFDNEAAIALFHFTAGAWQNVTTSLDVQNNKVCGQVNSLSPFALFQRQAHAFSGFFQPIDNQPTRNTSKAGAAIPVKFSLNGYQGMTIFASGYPSSQSIGCSGGTASDLVEETVTANASGLTYDPAADRYHYVWKTDRAWTQSCRRLTIRLNDGSVHSADFEFLK